MFMVTSGSNDKLRQGVRLHEITYFRTKLVAGDKNNQKYSIEIVLKSGKVIHLTLDEEALKLFYKCIKSGWKDTSWEGGDDELV